MGKVPDWLMRTKSDEAAVDAGCTYDQEAVDHVRYFFERFLRHSKGKEAGKPFHLLDWEYQRVVAPVYGWRMPDGTRRIRECGVAVAKKNGKSTLLAGLGLLHLVGDGEAGAEVYSAAADRAQASIIYSEAANMVEASPALQARISLVRASKTMRYPAGQGVLTALSAEVPTKEGLNWSALLFDELHAQKQPDLWNTLRYGGIAREQPLLFWITTAGVDRSSICFARWQKMRDVRDGKAVDIRVLPVLFEPDEGDDWAQESTWYKANPSLGHTMTIDSFRADWLEASLSPAEENNFKRYRLNMWTQQVTRWIAMSAWDKCRKEGLTADQFRGKPLWFGLDLASTTDMAAGCMVFKLPAGLAVFPRFWVPEDMLFKRERENKTRLDEWVRRGFITATPGNVIDYSFLKQDLYEMTKGHSLQGVCIDPWNATQIAVDMLAEGYPVLYVRTGFLSISGATKEFEKQVLGGTLQHPGNPVLDWCVENVAVETDASANLKPSKVKSAEKIDGVVAAILAIAEACKTGPKKKSKYETQGVDFV